MALFPSKNRRFLWEFVQQTPQLKNRQDADFSAVLGSHRKNPRLRNQINPALNAPQSAMDGAVPKQKPQVFVGVLPQAKLLS
jgi:hypothetical protein